MRTIRCLDARVNARLAHSCAGGCSSRGWRYAFGGGGSGDSTREGENVTTSVGASLCQDQAVRSLSTTWIAALLEQLLIAGQQSETG
jgi:hypothetical protein